MNQPSEEQINPALTARFPKAPSGGEPEPGSPLELAARTPRRDITGEWMDHRRDPGSYGVPLDSFINDDRERFRTLDR